MKVHCKRRKTIKLHNKGEVVQFYEGKDYVRVYPEMDVKFVIAEDGYKQMFTNDFHKYFEECR